MLDIARPARPRPHTEKIRRGRGSPLGRPPKVAGKPANATVFDCQSAVPQLFAIECELPTSATNLDCIPARNRQHVLFGEDQLGESLPMAPQFSLLADAGHVIAGIADGAQDAAVFGRQRTV
jgi:hypothetical protein